MRKVALFAVLAIFLMSCSETKRVTYLQKVESLPVEVLQQKSLLADPRIVPGDLLSISVGSDSPESVSIFNKLSSSGPPVCTRERCRKRPVCRLQSRRPAGA